MCISKYITRIALRSTPMRQEPRNGHGDLSRREVYRYGFPGGRHGKRHDRRGRPTPGRVPGRRAVFRESDGNALTLAALEATSSVRHPERHSSKGSPGLARFISWGDGGERKMCPSFRGGFEILFCNL